MWRTKRSNSSNLIICGAPAIKVPKPPVSNDDSKKSSILKALEAIVVAGRLGLFGPAAMGTVEGMPDVECCDGKVNQETPSYIPPLGEEEEGEKEEGKEEKKEREQVVNQEGNIDVTVTRPVNDTTKFIWICGDQAISFSEKRLYYSPEGRRLGFPASVAAVAWRGVRTMMWDDLLPNLHQLYHQCRFPSIVVIHLGENDLLVDSSHSLVTKMQNDLVILQKAFQDVVIIWSSLLPKNVWKPSEKSEVMESERNNVNCRMEEFCNENGMHYFSHPLLSRENRWLFTKGNVLSKTGAYMFLSELRKVLQTYLDHN